MIRPELVAFLKANGANTTAHSGNTLWDHLEGVYQLLKTSGAPEYLCEAGLFHSIYGTQVFKKISVERDRRHEVQALIGEKAEAIVWAFCHLDRPALFESNLRLGCVDWLQEFKWCENKEAFFADLLHLECANLLEQKKLYQFPCLAKYAQGIGMLDGDGFSI